VAGLMPTNAKAASISELGKCAAPMRINLWALAAVPVALGLSQVAWPVPRGRWAFYGYYVGHLACLGLVALILPP